MRVIKAEEERFAAMVTFGLERLEGIISEIVKAGKDTIPGTEIFKLYDSFGFPLDFTKEIADEKSLRLDMEGFQAELEKQRERARQSWKGDDNEINPLYQKFQSDGGTPFLGYQALQSTNRVIGILRNGSAVATLDDKSGSVEIVLDQTPFYAESGGQVGDTGTFTSSSGLVRVLDTYSPIRGVIVHKSELMHGALRVGEEVQAEVDSDRRRRIAANHTGTHILQAALRNIVGTHIKQAGSLVAPDRLRFDYTHFAPLTDREIREIEENINNVVFRNLPVRTEVKTMSEAVAAGALAFFGEKYAEQVRVVSIPDVSMELCGGTHTRMTGDVGLFKIIGDSSVASGVRRIEALTGSGTFQRLEEDEDLLKSLSHTLRTPRQELSRVVNRMLDQQRQLENELEALKLKSARSGIDGGIASQKTISGTTVISAQVNG
jgi:alanyl-tRNA synthetase